MAAALRGIPAVSSRQRCVHGQEGEADREAKNKNAHRFERRYPERDQVDATNVPSNTLGNNCFCFGGNSLADQDVWANALKESESPELRDPNLWARSFAEADGDDAKARAAYIKARVNASAPSGNRASERGWCPACHDAINMDAMHCNSCNSNLAARGMSPLKYRPTGPSPQSQQGTQERQVVKTAKSRGVYIILGLFFGMIGIHNFYAGRFLRGALQFLSTAVLGWFVIGLVISFIWVVIDLFSVTTDGDGDPFA